MKSNKKFRTSIIVLILCFSMMSPSSYGFSMSSELISEDAANAANALTLICSESEVSVSAEKREVCFYAQTENENENEYEYVKLLDGTGTSISEMLDDGIKAQSGDNSNGDGIYSSRQELTVDKTENLEFYAEAKLADGTVLRSNVVTLSVCEGFTAKELESMSAVDKAIKALVSDPAYDSMTEEEKASLALKLLEEQEELGNVRAGTIYCDDDNGMYSFLYSCGVMGGIQYKLPQEADAAEEEYYDETTGYEKFSLKAANAVTVEERAKGIIYYAFDEFTGSSRAPKYKRLQSSWNSQGISTTLDTAVTVQDLKEMVGYEAILISAHGSMYTRKYGGLWGLFEKEETLPTISLVESVTDDKDNTYKSELDNYQVLKINGHYAIRPGFFSSKYSNTAFDGSFIYIESCQGIGKNGEVDDSLAKAFINNGAEACVAFHNTVYSNYAFGLAKEFFDCLFDGKTAEQGFVSGSNIYGRDDVIWGRSVGIAEETLAEHTAAFPIINVKKWGSRMFYKGKVTLETNGGIISSGNLTEYAFGTEVMLPAAGQISKAGASFAGWYDNKTFSGSPVTSIGADETGDKTYYAKWDRTSFNVVLETNGGVISSGNVTGYDLGTEVMLPAAGQISKTGYAFGGWYEDKAFSGSAVTSIGADETGDKTYYAKWIKNRIESIEIKQKPLKLVYEVGQECDWTGMAVEAVYTDGSRAELSADEYIVEGFNSDFAGNKTITVSAAARISVRTTFDIVVNKKSVVGEPAYIPIQSAGKTLLDARLSPVGLDPSAGEIGWIDDEGNWLSLGTEVIRNRSYKWRFVPVESETYAIREGSVVLYFENEPVPDDVKNAVTGYTGIFDKEAHDAVEIDSQKTSDYTIKFSDSKDGEYSDVNPKVVSVSDSGSLWVEISREGYETVRKEVAVTISKAIWTDTAALVEAQYGREGYVDLSRYIAEGGSLGTPTVRADDFSILDGAGGYLSGNNLNFAIADDRTKVGKRAEYAVSVTGSTDYEDYDIVVSITALDKPAQNITFAESTETVTYGDGNFTNAALGPADGGRITYRSDNPDVAAVNENTGEVTILKAGEVKITAEAAETDEYAAGTASYMLKVERRPVRIIGITVSDKEYDGTADATASEGLIEGKLEGDNLNIAPGIAVFVDKNVGADKAVTFSGYNLDGADKDNYTLREQPASVTASIIAKVIPDEVKNGVTGYTGTYDEEAHDAVLIDSEKTLGYTIRFSESQDGEYFDVTPEVLNVSDSRSLWVEISREGYDTVKKEVSCAVSKAKWTETFAVGEAKYGTEGYVDLSQYIAAGGAVGTITKTDDDNIVDGDGRLTDNMLTFVMVNDITLAGKTVTFEVPVTESDNYQDYTITVTSKMLDKSVQHVSFAEKNISVTYGDGSFTNAASGPADGGRITYSSNNPDVAAVKQETGEVTILKAGEVKITAEAAETDEYAAGTASYMLKVGRRPVTIIGVTASDKEYDGTNKAVVSQGTLEGKLDGDELTIVEGVAVFADKNVGTDKDVTFAGYSLGGADKDNYTLTEQPASVKASITARPVKIIDITASDKEYDGTNKAVVSQGTLEGKRDGDELTIVKGVAVFTDKNVGTDKDVTFAGYSLGGADKDNYTLTEQPASVKASIIAKAIPDEVKDGVTGYTGVYDEEAHYAVAINVEKTSGYVMKFSDSMDGEYTAVNPQLIDVDDSRKVWVEISREGYVSVKKEVAATISKAVWTDNTVNAEAKYGNEGRVDLSRYIAEGGSLGTPTVRADDFSILDGAGGYLSGNNLNFAIADDRTKVGKRAEYAVSVTGSTDYEDYDIVVRITALDKAAQNISFAESTKTVTYGDGNFTNAASGPADGGRITYSSDNPDVAAVNQETGEVTILKAGEVKITANAAANNDYAEETAEYILTVNPVILTITAEDKTAYVGGSVPEFTYTAVGFVKGDSLQEEPTLTIIGGESAMEKAGIYTIVVTGGQVTNSDGYEINYSNGTFTVKQKPASAGGGGGGGGGATTPSIQVPTIEAGEGVKVTLSTDGTTATITAETGYEIADVVLNGASKGAVTTVSGLKTGDKLAVTAAKKSGAVTEEEQKKAEAITGFKLTAKSKLTKMKSGKKAIRITWNTSEYKFDGVEVWRSTKRNSGYGKKPMWIIKAKNTKYYYNTAIKKGKTYYYKLRGYVEINGQKYYTPFSNKVYRKVK